MHAGAAATLTNTGSIVGGSGYGVYLVAGGKITNSTTTARISGGTNGVLVTVGAAIITNAGTIAATNGSGVLISVGGTVTNSGAAAHITGLSDGVQATLGALTVINQGTISGSSGSGVFLSGGGSVSNATTAARITAGKFGVFFGGTTAGTVTNKGTISGAVAVQFSNKANNNLLREFPGAVTTGLVSGGSSTGNTVELGSAASTGSITGIGSQFVLFQVFDVDTGAKWLMTGANTLGSVATIGLSGTGSLGVTGTLTAPTNLTITGTGTLAANGGGRIEVGTAGTAVANQIAVDAAHTLTTSGVLSAATLAVASGGLLIGTGTLMGTMANAGTVEATGGTLDLAGSVDPASSGLFAINTASLLEIAADTGTTNTMRLIGSSGELAIDAVAQFGTHVGQASYTGPLIENFGAGGSIDLKNMGFAGAIIDNYAPGTGLLQLRNGAVVATLAFQNSSLGAGSFHIDDDGSGHVLVSHHV